MMNRNLLVTGVCIVLGVSHAAMAHEDNHHCEAVTASVHDAGFADDVDVTCRNGAAILTSTTFPTHDMMTGIVGTNEQVPVPAISYAAPVPLSPTLGTTPQTRDAALGVAVNGVPIYDYTGGGEMSIADLAHHQTQDDTILTRQLDQCGGHAGRGDDYHYHAEPTCMIAQMPNAGPGAIIGWAFDGFPIYGAQNPDGSVIEEASLDVCNGQPDDVFGYRYHTSPEAPYIIQCLMGEVVNIRDLPRVAPLRASGNQRVLAGKPPRGGVDNLVFTQDPSGGFKMSYDYQGTAYYIAYGASDTANCYMFETRTVTNGGRLFEGELCR